MKYYYIYSVLNKLTSKIYYGKRVSAVEPINDKYMGSGKILKQSITKNGAECFEKNIVAECESLEKLNELERLIIDKSVVESNMTYNLIGGGYGPTVFSEEAKDKLRNRVKEWWSKEGNKKIMSEKMKGRKLSEVTKAKMKGRVPYNKGKKMPPEFSQKLSKSLVGKQLGKIVPEEVREKIKKSLIGHKVSKETREKISKSSKGKTLSKESRDLISQKNKGRVVTQETKDRISKANKGKKVSEETIKKISLSRSGIKNSEETRAKISEANKGKVFSEERKRKISESKIGKPRDEQTRDKVSEGLKQFYEKKRLENGGSCISEETRQKLKNRIVSEETKAKMREAHLKRKTQKHD